jgi:ubiquinone/menaquinone biosynthesis C-methylase UbiE
MSVLGYAVADSHAETALEDESGLQLNAISWLVDHHRTKEVERRRMVDDLGLRQGEIVLDLGCGPGFWAPMLADKVAPAGRVVGLDISKELLRHAETMARSSPHRNSIEFREGTFYDLPFPDQSFDFVFFGNCFMYVTDTDRALEEQLRVTRPGGRIAAKDFDGSVFVVHPMDVELSLRVLAATAEGLRVSPPDPHFDNFCGRRLHGMFLRAGFKNVSTRPYAIQKVAPLLPEAERYIRANAEWYIEQAAPHLSERDVRTWKAHFDASSPECILGRDDFYFCMLEVVTTGMR